MSDSRAVSVELQNDQRGIGEVVNAFFDFAAKHSLPGRLTATTQLALDEILSNIVKYGYDDDAKHTIEVIFRIASEMLEIEIVDDSRPFDMLDRPDPDTSKPLGEKPIGGLGILLVKLLMDAHEYVRRDGMNHLLLRKRIL